MIFQVIKEKYHQWYDSNNQVVDLISDNMISYWLLNWLFNWALFIAKCLKQMISERFPNDLSSQRFLARTTVTRPFAACFSLKALEFWKSDPWIISKSGKTIEKKIELEKSFSHSIFQGIIQRFKKKSSHFESSNPPMTNQSTSTRTLLSSVLMSALSLSTFSFLGPGPHAGVGNGWTVTIHPPPWLTSNVQHKGPVQKTICDPHQAIKFGWKKVANIVSCVNLLLRLVSKVAEACQLQAVKQLHRTGMSRIPNK